jgi:hypothetical protein
MNGLLEPIHKSYRLSLTLALLVGVFGFSTYYYYEKYTTCQASSSAQQAQINVCSDDLAAVTTEKLDLKDQLEQALSENREMQAIIDMLRELLAQAEQIIADLRVQVQSLTAQNAADTQTIVQLNEALETCQSEEARPQDESGQAKRDDAYLQISLPGLVAVQEALQWLADHWYLAVILVLAAGMVVILFYRNLTRLHGRLPSARSCPPDIVRVSMTRKQAREYAHRSRFR